MNKLVTATIGAMFFATSAMAGGHAAWKSVGDESLIAFGSVKKDVVGEVHTFGDVSGTVSETGDVAIAIQLGSVETNIDIRNERMIEHVFKGMDAVAELTGSVDMDDVSELEVGATTVTDFEGTLSLAGVTSDVETELFVARLAEDRVLVTTSDILMLSTDDIGVNAGVDKLMELASLPGITRVSPATIRMVFEK